MQGGDIEVSDEAASKHGYFFHFLIGFTKCIYCKKKQLPRLYSG
jgi:hypothetical protein